MSVTRRTRLAVIAAAASGALIVVMAGTALASEDVGRLDCSDAVQDAEAALDTVARSELRGLDRVCETIPTLDRENSEDSGEGTPETTPAAAPDENSADAADSDDSSDENGDDEKSEDGKSEDKGGAGDRDCADFDSQADAQAAFEESSNDEDGLDADDDDVACEEHFGTEDQQVAVHPRGGVATGGSGLS
jgi:hypothetical protein